MRTLMINRPVPLLILILLSILVPASSSYAQSWSNTDELSGAVTVNALLYVSSTLYAATGTAGNVYKSTDGGETWENTGELTGAGTVYALLEYDGAIYAGASGGGAHVFKSTNGGSSWTDSGTVFGDWIIYSLLEYDGTIYAGTGTTQGDVYKSTDGGSNWSNTGNLSGAYWANCLMESGGAIYACANTGAGDVFKTTDDGDTWNDISDFVDTDYVYSLLEGSDGAIYAGTAMNGDVFKTTNGGTSWTNTSDLDGAGYVHSLLEVNSVIYAAISDPPYEIFKTTDYGLSWGRTGGIPSAVYILLNVGNTIYAGTAGSGDVYKGYISICGNSLWVDSGCQASSSCTLASEDYCDTTVSPNYLCTSNSGCSGDFCTGNGAACDGSEPYCYCVTGTCSCHADAKVNLLDFSAERSAEGVKLNWKTAQEIECGAFKILRCETDTPGACELWNHTELDITVPCLDNPNGADYSAVDPTAKKDQSYSYYLREYDTTDRIFEYGPMFISVDDSFMNTGHVEPYESTFDLLRAQPGDDDPSTGSGQADDEEDNGDLDDSDLSDEASAESEGACGKL